MVSGEGFVMGVLAVVKPGRRGEVVGNAAAPVGESIGRFITAAFGLGRLGRAGG